MTTTYILRVGPADGYCRRYRVSPEALIPLLEALESWGVRSFGFEVVRGIR